MKAPRTSAALLARAALLAAAIGGFALAGCAAPADESATAAATSSFVSMDTAMSITAYAPGAVAAKDAAAGAELVQALDAELSPADDGSAVARLNAADGRPLAVEDDVLDLVEASLDATARTGGAFDPTIYPLTKAWGFVDGAYRRPSEDEIDAALALVGADAVRVDAAAGAVALGGAQLDLGGIAKGYAADRVVDLLEERGASAALLDLGGNVTAFGTKPDGSPWAVGIADPRAPDELAGTLSVTGGTVSTSGDYQRWFVDDEGVRRCHLIDPNTGYPACAGLSSASVVGERGAQCDALSTALFVMGADRAVAFWRASQGDEAFEAVLVTDDGRVLVTEGIAGAFAPSATYEGRVETVSR